MYSYICVCLCVCVYVCTIDIYVYIYVDTVNTVMFANVYVYICLRRSAGKPLVATRIGGPAEIVSHDQDGYACMHAMHVVAPARVIPCCTESGAAADCGAVAVAAHPSAGDVWMRVVPRPCASQPARSRPGPASAAPPGRRRATWHATCPGACRAAATVPRGMPRVRGRAARRQRARGARTRRYIVEPSSPGIAWGINQCFSNFEHARWMGGQVGQAPVPVARVPQSTLEYPRVP